MTKETITSRYGETRTITKVPGKERTYIISGKSHYMRGGGSREDGNYYIDFEGGPFLGQGGRIDGICTTITGEIADVESVVSPEGWGKVYVTLMNPLEEMTKIAQENGEYDLSEEDQTCGGCGDKMESVRPGKHQCNRCEAVADEPFDTIERLDDSKFWQDKAEHYRSLLERIARENPDIDVIAMAK